MRRRLLVSYLLIAVLVLVLLEIPLGIAYAENERSELTDKVERDAVALATLVEDSLEHETPVPQEVQRTAARYDAATDGRVLVVDAQGLRIVDTAPTGSSGFSSRPEIALALRGEIATGTRRSNTLGTDLLYVAVPVASSGVVHGAVRITYPMSAVNDRIHRYWWILGLIAAGVLAVAVGVALVLARWVARPLARLERAAESIATGDLTARVDVAGPPEVRQLAETFNGMVAKLDVLVRSQDEFVADASHELRTPLAALRLRLENLERDLPESERLEVEGALAEVARLGALVDALLALARADRAEAAPRPLDVTAAVDERLAAWSALADERRVRLEAESDPAVVALVTTGRFEQMLDNLLANALDVSPEGAAITVSVRPAASLVEIHVVDEGPGMSAGDRVRAFDRFWRAGRAQEGFGLGLAIVERLVTADGGRVELRESAGGGLDAVVTLRRAPRDGESRPSGR
ncbi:MAG: ATP-binding protein [Thermoleophilia bacterium]|nr:ATP-binding protein [Thermoleophilia bacterium]MDH4340988.1 ATP-binding protein [Thermoleophilia bacterium]MDH5280368.1 ATP-binding protein [Thermoleophilia bacterium]